MNDKILLKGTPASLGLVNGKVKKIVFPYDFTGFEQGSILVTEMTSPLFIPVMKKAGAVVTDIGGLLCHAAIVSREFGIPCIVNTGNGTQILKDGQSITVNATKGEIYETK
jgi:pyruvate,water dikinase